MTAKGFAFFETAIGTCALAWGERGVVAAQLPEHDETHTRARMRKRFPGLIEREPPADIRRAIDGVVALMQGEPRDLLEVELDMGGVPEFNRRVYDIARAIPPGQTLTYGDVAEKLNAPGAARAVGRALGQNPIPIVVPCHRILAAGAKTGGFSAPGGTTTKLRMLTIEGAKLSGTPSLFEDLPLIAPPKRPRSTPNQRR